MQGGKTGMCLPSRSGKESALPQLSFHWVFNTEFYHLTIYRISDILTLFRGKNGTTNKDKREEMKNESI